MRKRMAAAALRYKQLQAKDEASRIVSEDTMDLGGLTEKQSTGIEAAIAINAEEQANKIRRTEKLAAKKEERQKIKEERAKRFDGYFEGVRKQKSSSSSSSSSSNLVLSSNGLFENDQKEDNSH